MVDRKTLDEIILKNGAEDWWQPERFIQHTLPLLPPELQVLENPPATVDNFNCFLFALGLSKDNEIIKDSSGFIYSAFIKQLLETGRLVTTQEPTAGDYVVYQDLVGYPDEITHAGILQEDNSVISKWAWGPLVKHSVMDVPASYGDHVWYIKAIPPEIAKTLYWEYKSFNTKPA